MHPVLLVVASALLSVDAAPEFFPSGSPCGPGAACRPARQCPAAVAAIVARGGIRPRRCGFRGFDELVCCEDGARARPLPPPTPSATPTPTPTPKRRAATRTPAATAEPGESPSQRACQRYRKDYRDELSNDIIEFKIVGGEEVEEGEFPYMVAIGYSAPRRSNITWACGGSLISERYVLTAAHCITDTREQGLRPVALRVGARRVGGARGPGDYAVEAVQLHPQHREGQRYFDLALLRTERAVAGGARPVCLPAPPPARAPEDAPATRLLAAGWGAVDPAGFESSPVLKKVALRAVAATECARRLGVGVGDGDRTGSAGAASSALPRGLDPDAMLCAGGASGEDTCRGDSGGPLVARADGRDTLVAVTSFGGNPCGGLRPGVYARVAPALRWIEGVVWP